MPLSPNFIPQIPFPDFKWKWACLQCTEGLNDPVVLLGVLSCLNECAGKRFKSEEFANALAKLQEAISNSGCSIRLSARVGERNLMRNSGQYWKALGLIPRSFERGVISVTSFGKAVAERKISQTDFAASTILSLTLPNPNIQQSAECALWKQAGIMLHPLSLILQIILHLFDHAGESEAYITVDELCRIIIPLSSYPKSEVVDYANFIVLYRREKLSSITSWPKVTTRANDVRIAREFLLFLNNYGYVAKSEGAFRRENEEYRLNTEIIDEIRALLSDTSRVSSSLANILNFLKDSSLTSELERKRICSVSNRPNQISFRNALFEAYPKCIISGVSMKEVLQAAHIKPFKYKGEDNAANGFLMRSDIHILFDSGNLRISPTGKVVLSDRARMSYGESAIRDQVVIPDHIDRANLEWRWNYYHAL